MSSMHFLYDKPSREDEISDHPLTHHEIMALVAPFTACGIAVELRASDRARRRLAFRPVQIPAADGVHPVLERRLQLSLPDRAPARLERTLVAPNGSTALLTIEGDDPHALLAHLDDVAPERQMREVGGVLLARSYRIRTSASPLSRSTASGGDPAMPRIMRAEARVGEVTLEVSEGLSRAPFDVVLKPAGRRLHLTEDFLAVLGWAWRPLRAGSNGVWRGSVKLPSREPARTSTLEALVDEAAAHVARTLSRPPDEFHRRHSRARWRVVFQRTLPILVGGGALLALSGLAFILPRDPVIQTVLLHIPPLMMIGFFTLNEVPTLEIPPFPRGLKQAHWYPPAEAATAHGAASQSR
jgi:hypothetical protein